MLTLYTSDAGPRWNFYCHYRMARLATPCQAWYRIIARRKEDAEIFVRQFIQPAENSPFATF
jgi:hypothetical protein